MWAPSQSPSRRLWERTLDGESANIRQRGVGQLRERARGVEDEAWLIRGGRRARVAREIEWRPWLRFERISRGEPSPQFGTVAADAFNQHSRRARALTEREPALLHA